MKLFRRPLYAWLALLGFVFSQLAVSAYACPFWSELNPSGGSSPMVADGDMAGMHCAEMGMASTDTPVSALCVQHCDQGNQTVGSPQPLDFQPTLFILPFVPPLSQLEVASELFLQAPLLARAASPPPLWRTGRLRI
jgi:hypothetical protein